MADDQYRDDLNLEELKGYLDKPSQDGGDASLEDILKEYHEERVLAPRQRPAGASSGLLENPYADEPGPDSPPEEALEDPGKEPDGPAEETEAAEPQDPEPQEEEPALEPPPPEPEKSKVIEMPGLRREEEPPEEPQEEEPAGEDDEDEPEDEPQEESPPVPRGPTLSQRVLQLLIRLRTRKPQVLEKPKPEPSPNRAARMARDRYRVARRNSRAAFICCVPLLYLLFSHRWGLPLPRGLQYLYAPYTHLFLTLILEAVVVFFGMEVVVRGLKDLKKLRPSGDTLVAMSCLTSMLHGLTIMLFPKWGGYLPYCAVSALSMAFALWGHASQDRAKFITLRMAGLREECYALTYQDAVYEDKGGFLKRRDSRVEGFVTQVESTDFATRVMGFLAPLLLVASLVFALVASVGHGAPELFFWCWSAISAAAALFSASLSFSRPFLRLARRLKDLGSAVAGDEAMAHLSRPGVFVLQDDDLFPPGSVTLNGLKIFHGYRVEDVVSYVYNLAYASGSSLGRLFESVLQGERIPELDVEEVTYYDAGGVTGMVEGARVLMGTQEYMRRSGVRLPDNIAVEQAILVAVNYELAGVFAMHYVPAASVARTLPQLSRSKQAALLATRDFNITPQLLHEKYRVDLRALEYPPVEQRVHLSEQEAQQELKPLAVITREGLAPYLEAVLLARRAYRVSRLNTWLNTAAALLSVLLMAFIVSAGAFASASPCNLIYYMLLWLVPTLMATGYVGA